MGLHRRTGVAVGDVHHHHYYSQPTSAVAVKDIDPDRAECQVIKATVEQRYTLGIAYPAMKTDVAVAQDGHRDFVSAEALEKCAWSWMAKNRDIGLFHQDGTEGHGTVVESYIWRADPWVIKAADGTQTVNLGDWLLGVQWDDHGWDLVKAGLVRGWSPEGRARRSIPDAARLSELRS